MRPILFIDRDGTLVAETADEFVDKIEKISFLPEVLYYLRKIQKESNYLLILVSNQPLLGTPAFDEDRFYPIHNFIMRTLEGEGINFDAVHIDEHAYDENHLNTKPKTGMLLDYIKGDYDLKQSFVIGDRLTDVQLSKNLGCKAIHLSDQVLTNAALTTTSWEHIYEFLVINARKVKVIRNTKETYVEINLNLEGTGQTKIDTGLHFFDHMLDQLGKHGGIDLSVDVKGDLEIDEHHTIEDTALALGEAFHQSLGAKKGLNRYGFLLPMDDALAQVAIDFGGRPWLVWEAEFIREMVGDMPTEIVYHFFKSFSDAAKCNLNIKVEGTNEHHMIESLFKSFGRAIKMAVRRNEKELSQLPTTKGIL